MTDWTTALDNVRAKRTTALDNGDIDTLRDMLLHAAAFAIFTIRQRTATAERAYIEWCDSGIVCNSMHSMRSRAIDSMHSWTDGLTIEDMRRYIGDGWTLAHDIEANINGLGCTKASFSAALFGATEAYCIDVWGTRYAAIACGAIDYDIDTWKDAFNKRCHSKDKNCQCNTHIAEDIRSHFNGRKDRWTIYHAIGDAVFGDAHGQWTFFESADPTFNDGGHDAYFNSIA